MLSGKTRSFSHNIGHSRNTVRQIWCCLELIKTFWLWNMECFDLVGPIVVCRSKLLCLWLKIIDLSGDFESKIRANTFLSGYQFCGFQRGGYFDRIHYRTTILFSDNIVKILCENQLFMIWFNFAQKWMVNITNPNKLLAER